MALGKRWSLTFKSRNNTTCNVYIYDEGWTGAVSPLIGAADPFEYEEDTDESLLTVLRYRTGYLRIVEPDYGTLQALYPTHRWARYVEFYYGSRLDFTGYLQTQNFQNDWVASPRVLEFPVISPLGLCDTQKFSLYTTPTRITLGACMYNILTALNSHAATGSRYTKIIFPDTGPEFTGTINTMVISGFSDQFSHADPNSPVFAAEYFDYFLEGLCNAYGWILHDTPDAFIFTRFDWDGDYAYYDLTTLAVPINKQTVADVAGHSVNTLLNSYQVRDADATESLIQPMKSLTLNYEGDFVSNVDMDLDRTYTDSVITVMSFDYERYAEHPGVVWLKPADNEFSGARLLETNTLTDESPTTAGCNLTYSGGGNIGFEERVLIKWGSNWSQDSELFRWKIYQPPVGTCNVKIKISWGTKVGQLGTEERSNHVFIGLWIYSETNGYYRFVSSWTDNNWTNGSTPIIKYLEFDDSGNTHFAIAKIPVGMLTFGFVVAQTPGIDNGEIISIDSVTLDNTISTFAQYTEVQNPTDIIEGSDVGNMEGSVSLSLNCYRNDTHLIGLTPVADKFTLYPYLFEPMNRIVCHFTASDYNTLKNYLGKWKFWVKWWRWRIIAVSFEPWNDLYTLVLHRSPSIETRGYLADVNDNVFVSLDEYLFTVLEN